MKRASRSLYFWFQRCQKLLLTAGARRNAWKRSPGRRRAWAPSRRSPAEVQSVWLYTPYACTPAGRPPAAPVSGLMLQKSNQAQMEAENQPGSASLSSSSPSLPCNTRVAGHLCSCCCRVRISFHCQCSGRQRPSPRSSLSVDPIIVHTLASK